MQARAMWFYLAFPCAAVLSPLLRSAAPRSRLSSFRMLGAMQVRTALINERVKPGSSPTAQSIRVRYADGQVLWHDPPYRPFLPPFRSVRALEEDDDLGNESGGCEVVCELANWKQLPLRCSISHQRLLDPAHMSACTHLPTCNYGALVAYVARCRQCPVAGCTAQGLRSRSVMRDDALREGICALPATARSCLARIRDGCTAVRATSTTHDELTWHSERAAGQPSPRAEGTRQSQESHGAGQLRSSAPAAGAAASATPVRRVFYPLRSRCGKLRDEPIELSSGELSESSSDVRDEESFALSELAGRPEQSEATTTTAGMVHAEGGDGVLAGMGATTMQRDAPGQDILCSIREVAQVLAAHSDDASSGEEYQAPLRGDSIRFRIANGSLQPWCARRACLQCPRV